MSAAAVSVLPRSIADIRLHMIRRVAALLSSLLRNQQLSQTIRHLTVDTHKALAVGMQDVLDELAALDLPPGAHAPLQEKLRRLLNKVGHLDATLPLLLEMRQSRARANRDDLRDLLLRFDETTQQLAGTMVQKQLLERQSEVLEQIILSHEKVTQWKIFAQEILTRFRTVFPFQFFFITFAEAHGLSLNLYYVGRPDPKSKQLARERLIQRMFQELQIPEDAPLDIDEFEIQDPDGHHTLDEVEMITVAVPEIENINLAGLLGVAYASNSRPGPQEIAIIRSILAVMVMVVGSSKALSRTLSELEYYSSHDPLTGLHNRRYFNEMLEYEVGRSMRHKHEFSLLMLDLDNFKDVNDSWGHPFGDTGLRGIAECLQAETRKGDLSARLGGDEFILLLTETGREGAHAVAEKLRQRLKENRYETPEGKLFHVTTSVGVVTYPGDASTVVDLMAGVDMGLYRAKALGKDSVVTLESVNAELKSQRKARDMVEQLRQALREERVLPYFQPIYSGRTGELFAYETLARMQEDGGETIPAGSFIEAVEKHGLGRELDRTVIRQALHALRRRLDEGRPPVKLFINLSVQEMQGRGVIGYAEDLCAQLSIPPSTLVFELLERDAIGDMTQTRRFIEALREKGFLFALDDFGSGYNSFHYLRELSFDFVKIDGAFVRNVLSSKIDHSLVRNLTHLCQDIGIRVVAEFVESEALWDVLRGMGVDFGQGYHLGLPVSQMP